jgi:hypothetical protein
MPCVRPEWEHLFTDHISGAKSERPGLRLLEVARLLLEEEQPTHFISLSDDDEDTEITRAVRVKINVA